MAMSENGGAAIYTPAEAAKLLSISVSGLRRYGAIYDEVYDPLPRDPQNRRVWTHAAVTRLRHAKGLVDTGRAVSIQAALENNSTPVQDNVEIEVRDPQNEALRRLGAALDTITKLEQTNQQLIGEVVALRQKLEQGDPNADELRRLNEYLMAELERARAAPAPSQEVKAKGEGPLTRAIRWVEGFLSRSGRA